MHLQRTLKDGTSLSLVMRQVTSNRLSLTCFRGRKIRCAGNFSMWSGPEPMFRNNLVRAEFNRHLSEMFTKDEFGTHSVTIESFQVVGWESTAPLKDFDENQLEPFEPNRHSSALRVRRDLENILAPQTNKVTIVFEFKREGEAAAAIIHSIYPGNDVGELDGDLTDREQCVFFDFDHPGAF